MNMPISFAIRQDACLKSFNTFGIDAKARYFTSVQSIHDFNLLLSDPSFQSIPKLILGDGSNILFTQDYLGLVIKNEIKGIQILSEDDEHVYIKVGAGENWHDFVMYCIERGYSGIENLSLIPGTVGAAPIQNIGAYGVELCDVFCELEAVHLSDGTLQTFSRTECQFGYRDSVFKNKFKNQYAILSVTIRLSKKPKFCVEYGNVRETLEIMQVKELSSRAVSDAVIHIRRSKLPDPKQLGNAGSFFKNPIISHAQFVALQNQFPTIPHFSTPNTDEIKIPAAWLIEQCGWKGKRLGEIGVYDKQALILVNYGAGTGASIQKLAQDIQQSVQEKFAIDLMPEVNFV